MDKRINIRLSGAVYDYFARRAEVSGQALSAVVVMALMEYLEQKDAMAAIQEMVRIETEKQVKEQDSPRV